MSLRLKLVLLVILPLAIVFSALVVIQYQSMRTLAIAQAQSHTLLLTQATARDIESALAKAVNVSHTGAAALEAAPELDGTRVWPLLEALVKRVPLVEGASVAFAPGSVAEGAPAAPYVWNRNGTLQRTDLGLAYDYTTRNWYTIAAHGDAGWTAPYDGPVFEGLLVSFSVPVIRHNEVTAVVSVDVPLLPLQDSLQVGEFTNTSGFLVGPGDRFISNPNPELIMKPVTSAGGPALLADSPPGTLQRFDDWPNETPHIVAFEPIPTADWMFAAAIEEAQVLGPVQLQLRWNVGILLGGGVIIAAIVLLTGLRITGDVRQLASAVAQVSGGNLSASIEHIRRHDELGKLAVDFNRMTKQLGRTVDRVASEQAARQAMERELDAAREIQKEMLPHEYPMLQGHPEIDLHAINEAARYVAGDFYDYWVRDGVLTVVLADVAGSGMPAALVMVRVMTLLRQFDNPAIPLTDIVALTNEELCNDNDHQLFVTGIIVRVTMATGEFWIVSAGHLSALLGDGHGQVDEEGMSTGPLLGVIPRATWADRRRTLPLGGWLALYTDGITEAPNDEAELFGTPRLSDTLSKMPGATSEVLARKAITAAEEWHGGRVDDDLSALVIRRPGPA